MKKVCSFILSALCAVSAYAFHLDLDELPSDAQSRPCKKVLHITFHRGCARDFEDVAKELDLDVTTWCLLDLPPKFFDGFTAGSVVYCITREYAELVYAKHKNYFEQFDAIVTSDTAPLARIFLQHNWKKPLIMWVCNRFDYFHVREPDPAYYSLIHQATLLKNVQIVSYTPYEYVYARTKGIELGEKVIKPVGCLPRNNVIESFIPPTVKKRETLCIYPLWCKDTIGLIEQECSKQGIKTWTGRFNGPDDLMGFKGIIYFPYQFSNLALFEGLQRGFVFYVPSKRFFERMHLKHDWVCSPELDKIQWCEWYMPEHKDLLVYFDSWEDLKRKIASTHSASIRKKGQKFARKHRDEMIYRWKQVFENTKTR